MLGQSSYPPFDPQEENTPEGRSPFVIRFLFAFNLFRFLYLMFFAHFFFVGMAGISRLMDLRRCHRD